MFINNFKKLPNRNEKYLWTAHSRIKMQYYGISEGRVKRIIRFPTRYEEGIVPDTIAVMQPAGTKRYQEIWVMYKIAPRRSTNNLQLKTSNKNSGIKIITAWRYPGKSPERDPIPSEVIKEIMNLL